jgi:hypothetical protein
MIDLHWIAHRPGILKAAVLFLVMLLPPCTACAQNYDALIEMLQNPDPSTQIKGKTMLAFTIKSLVISMDPEQLTDDCFLLGHFINPENPDLAVGISVPPGWGKLVILTQRGGHYGLVGHVINVAYIESVESVSLFPGPLEQIVLNVYAGGTETRQWGENILRWDGAAMRMVWEWTRKSIDKRSAPERQGEYIGRITGSEISFDNSRSGAAKEIVTRTDWDEGIFSDEKRQTWDLKKVTSHFESQANHKWDESLFFFVAKSGQILSTKITIRCSRGMGGSESADTLYAGMKVGILEMPGTALSEGEDYDAVIGKELFCQIPKSAVRLEK